MSTSHDRIPVYFHPDQRRFKPMYEWAFGERIDHPERTGRAESIVAAVRGQADRFDLRPPERMPFGSLQKIHDGRLLTLYQSARSLPEGEDFYPHVFPKSKAHRGDPVRLNQSGAFCFDSGTPLTREVWGAAMWSAGSAREAAICLRREGLPVTYAISRPPGHHAERDLFGGYCYLNNAALAARTLRADGRVAILDIDFHHGNGTQQLFYSDPKVLVVSLHGDPREFFPFYCGYGDESGSGRGAGYNLNLPLPRDLTGTEYLAELQRFVLPVIEQFDPASLVISAGFDTYEKDPVGAWGLTTEDIEQVGSLIGQLRRRTVVVQEGGYYTPDLGENAVRFLLALRAGQR